MFKWRLERRMQAKRWESALLSHTHQTHPYHHTTNNTLIRTLLPPHNKQHSSVRIPSSSSGHSAGCCTPLRRLLYCRLVQLVAGLRLWSQAPTEWVAQLNTTSAPNITLRSANFTRKLFTHIAYCYPEENPFPEGSQDSHCCADDSSINKMISSIVGM